MAAQGFRDAPGQALPFQTIPLHNAILQCVLLFLQANWT